MRPDELKNWRNKHSFTQKRLAGALDVTRLTIYRWEAGTRKIPAFLPLALEGLENRLKKGPTRLKGRAEK